MVNTIVFALAFLLALSCQRLGWEATDLPELRVPELEQVDVPPGQRVGPGEWEVKVSGGVEIPEGDGVIRCMTWRPGQTEFTLRSRKAGNDRWYLTVRPGESEGSVPPQMWLAGALGTWGRWNSPGAVDGLEIAANLVRFDVELSASDDSGGPAVWVTGWMRCPDLEGPNVVPQELVDLLGRATGADVNRWSTYEFGRLRDHRAISARVHASGLDLAVAAIRAALPKGWTAFVGTTRFLDGQPGEDDEDSEIVVAPGGAMEDILRIAHVSPGNYDMDTEDVVAKFREWDDRYGVDILRASVDTVRFRLRSLPDGELEAFAEEVYEFCPDIVDQGLGTPAALQDEIRGNRGAELWWD